MEDIITDETADNLIKGTHNALFTPDQIEYLEQQEESGLAKFILFMYKLQHKKEKTPEMKQLLEESHNLHCKFATYILAEIHEAQKNYTRAHDLYTVAHVYGYPRATVKLGECYMKGIGVRQDTERAKRLFQLAFAKGDPYGAFYNGVLDERDYNIRSAERWYKKAFNEGILEAAVKLGLLLEKDKPADAVDYYKQAYKKGYYTAAFYLGRLYKSGRGIDKDYQKAILSIISSDMTQKEFQNIREVTGVPMRYFGGIITYSIKSKKNVDRIVHDLDNLRIKYKHAKIRIGGIRLSLFLEIKKKVNFNLGNECFTGTIKTITEKFIVEEYFKGTFENAQLSPGVDYPLSYLEQYLDPGRIEEFKKNYCY